MHCSPHLYSAIIVAWIICKAGDTNSSGGIDSIYCKGQKPED